MVGIRAIVNFDAESLARAMSVKPLRCSRPPTSEQYSFTLTLRVLRWWDTYRDDSINPPVIKMESEFIMELINPIMPWQELLDLFRAGQLYLDL